MAAADQNFDVVVWGGGTGGVAAAIQASRSGASTVLLTPGSWLGGMVSAAGVCCPDGNELSPWQTGLWGAFLRALEQSEPDGLDHNWVSCFGYRPTTAEAILQEWVRAETNLEWWWRSRVSELEREGTVLTAVRVEHGGEHRRVGCRVVIDGSDRGDLFPLADVPFRFGWEAQETWGEPSAPARVRLESEAFFAEQPVQSPTWVVIGQLQSDALQKGRAGTIQPATQPDISAPFRKACDSFGLERTLTYGRLPSGLVMLNWPLHGNDWHDDLERAFRRGEEAEQELYADMQAHSLRFAASMQEASEGWMRLGKAFPKAAGSPAPWLAAMPYWREGRRMIGRHTLIEQELLPMAEGVSLAALPLNDAGELQSIAVGNYANDHHYPGQDWPLAVKSCRWGGRWTGTPFCIPYGALLSLEVDNLLAADKQFSTSHIANGATRLQPLILNLGQAAGAAAALSVELNCSPADLPVRVLQDALIHDRKAPAAVVPLWDTPWHHPQWSERQAAVVADPQRMLEGDRWPRDSDASGFDRNKRPLHHPRATRWSGRLVPDQTGGFTLHQSDGNSWPVITLEPSVHDWLSTLDQPVDTCLIGTANPWGPWLRISQRL